MQREVIGLWCNGNTTVFGAVFQGSSPCRPTINPALAGFVVFTLDEKFIPNLFREVLVDQQKNPLNLRGFFVFITFRNNIYILKVTTGRNA